MSRQATLAGQAPASQGGLQANAEIFQWLLANPDECASAVADAYSQWSPGADGEYGDFTALLRKEIAYQRLKAGMGGFRGREAL